MHSIRVELLSEYFCREFTLVVMLLSGEAYFRLSDWHRAESWYREALRIKPDHIPAHLTLAKLLHRRVSCQLSDDDDDDD